MPLFHAVALVDHHTAHVLQFGTEHAQEETVKEHFRVTREHASGVRSEHEFFGHVCDALDGVAEVLIAGGHTALADFKHYAAKHRPATAKRITGYEVVDHPTDKQLVALARKHFAKHDVMVGIPL
jgi:hypothetical protein